MSDEDFFSEDSYEFDFEVDGQDGSIDNGAQSTEEDHGILLENEYYEAKNLKYDEPDAAIRGLLSLATKPYAECVASEWKFKAYKQVVKIYVGSRQYQAALDTLQDMANIFSLISKSYAEDSLTRMINNYSASKNQEFVFAFYNTIINAILPIASLPNHDRIWLKISMNKLGTILDGQQFRDGQNLVTEIQSFMGNTTEYVQKTYALDLISAEIILQYHRDPLNLLKLGELYRKSTQVLTAVAHPRTLGRIQECGAIILFHRGNYEKARLQFYEAFNNFDEMGSSAKRKVLKYLALCAMLTTNELNPFVSQETRTYAQLPEFRNLLLMMQAYDSFNVTKFLTVLDEMTRQQDEFSQDVIFQKASNVILSNLRNFVAKRYISAFRQVKFASLIKELCFTSTIELKELIRTLAFGGELQGIKVDYINETISCGETRSFFRLDLSSSDFFRNSKIDDAIGLDIEHESQQDSTIDDAVNPTHIFPVVNLFSSSKTFRLNQLIYVTQPSPTIDWWLNAISSLLDMLYSALPDPPKLKLSQKDQIESRQRIESASNVINSQQYDTTSSAAAIADHDSDSENEEMFEVRKVDLLRNWASALRQKC